MVLGFNHNIMYKGEVYHVQTEDSGTAIPHIITLLYKGGVIICSKKTSYADILTIDNLEVVVEELMKEQHKELMRRLKTGEFDDRIAAMPAESADGNTDAVTATEESAFNESQVNASVASAKEKQDQEEREKERQAAKQGSKPSPIPVGITLDQAVDAFFAAHVR